MSTTVKILLIFLVVILIVNKTAARQKKVAWTPWTKYGPCTVTCGNGKRFKTRVCKADSCNGNARSGIPCRMPECPPKAKKWTPWTEYGPCTVTCGNGKRFRTRICKADSCNGNARSGIPCRKPACPPKAQKWTPWTEYGPCTVTCGNGKRFRTRMCKAERCNGNARSGKPCQNPACPKKGRWLTWTSFSKCSKTCGDGSMIRRRTCTGKTCVGPAFQRRRCNEQQCGVPSAWGRWGKSGACSKTCGKGTIVWTRTCKSGNCKGPGTVKKSCIIDSCVENGVWGQWKEFEPCTKSCGGGIKQRRRYCRTKGCNGITINTERCNTELCNDVWSACTKKCGSGTQYRYDSTTCVDRTNPKCFRTFRECNTNDCRTKRCPPGTERRYGSTSSCCLAEQNRRIINGKSADIDKWKWMVLLDFYSSTICGGSLITSKWVLTAGHCVDELGVSGMKGLRIYAGIRKYSEKFTATPYTVEAIHKHPRHKDLKYDIALVKLTKDVDLFSGKIGIISLPNEESTPIDSTCFTAGWGVTHKARSTPSEDLLQVNVQVLDDAVCHRVYQNTTSVKDYVLSTQNLMCAGSLSKTNDACRGDSGGPLVCQRCSSCEWYLAAITSFGPNGECGKPGSPGMYTRVQKFEAWIHQKVSALKTTKKSMCHYQYGP